RIGHIPLRADQGIDARSHALEGLRERIHLRMRLDVYVKGPVAIAEPSRCTLESTQIARKRPQPYHQHERNRSVENECQHPVEQPTLWLIGNVTKRQQSSIVCKLLEHPGPILAVAQNGHLSTGERCDHLLSRDILRLEQLEIHTSLGGELGHEGSSLLVGHVRQLLFDDGKTRRLRSGLGLPFLFRAPTVFLPQLLLPPAHRSERKHDECIELEEVADHGWAGARGVGLGPRRACVLIPYSLFLVEALKNLSLGSGLFALGSGWQVAGQARARFRCPVPYPPLPPAAASHASHVQASGTNR